MLDWTNDTELPFAFEGWGDAIVPMPSSAPGAKKGWNRAKLSFRAGHVVLAVNDQEIWETDIRIAGKFEPRLLLKNMGHAVGFSNIILIVPLGHKP